MKISDFFVLLDTLFISRKPLQYMNKKQSTSIKISLQLDDYQWKCSEMSTFGNEYTILHLLRGAPGTSEKCVIAVSQIRLLLPHGWMFGKGTESHRKIVFIWYKWNNSGRLSVKLDRLLLSPSNAGDYWALHMCFYTSAFQTKMPQFSPILTWMNSSHDRLKNVLKSFNIFDYNWAVGMAS